MWGVFEMKTHVGEMGGNGDASLCFQTAKLIDFASSRFPVDVSQQFRGCFACG